MSGAEAAVDALGLDDFHLVVHDIGGPVGFELAAAMPARVRSLTILNTLIEVAAFKRPWSMEPFARRGLGEIYLKTLTKPVFAQLMYLQGIGDRSTTPKEQVYAYVDLLKREDGGKGFLKIMRGFERTPEKQRLYESVVRDVPYPVQILWGADDPALSCPSTASKRVAQPAWKRSTRCRQSTSSRKIRRQRSPSGSPCSPPPPRIPAAPEVSGAATGRVSTHVAPGPPSGAMLSEHAHLDSTLDLCAAFPQELGLVTASEGERCTHE